ISRTKTTCRPFYVWMNLNQ
ncbi:hypothetical protein A5865_000492, partial [Enterococcus sp. 12E11_DIV0728]